MYPNVYSTTIKSSVEYELLPGNDSTSRQSWEDLHRKLRVSRRRWIIFALVELAIILLTQWTTFFRTYHHDTPYSLVDEVVRYETRVFNTGYPGDRTPYIGKPSPEVDALWDDLIHGGIIKITKEQEALLTNRTSPLLSNSNQFVSSLAVVHHLHCLDNLRQSLWPDHYPQFDARSDNHALIHLEHCIEILRQVHMCHPDTTAEVFQYDADQQKMIFPTDRQHTCVDFKAIQQWMRQRAVYDDEFNVNSYVEGAVMYQPAHATTN